MSIALQGSDELTSEEQQILDETDRFARGELYPLAPRMDHDEWWPDDLFPRLGAAGYLGIAVPEEYWGVGSTLIASGRSSRRSPAGTTRWPSAGSRTTTSASTACSATGTRSSGAEINRLYRANKLAEIGAGTTEVRKLIISDELLDE
jgi:isovaleryl-CoA dehydrogenase